MLAFHCEVHRYVDDQKLDARHVRDLKLDALHVDVQMMDVQMIYVLGDLLLGGQMIYVQGDQYAVLKYVTCRLLALMNENVRILELQRFHQLAFQHVA
jgi:hypothetical protein